MKSPRLWARRKRGIKSRLNNFDGFFSYESRYRYNASENASRERHRFERVVDVGCLGFLPFQHLRQFEVAFYAYFLDEVIILKYESHHFRAICVRGSSRHRA